MHHVLKNIIPDELVLLNELPSVAFVNGGFQGDQQFLLDLNTVWLKMFSADFPRTAREISSTDRAADNFL